MEIPMSDAEEEYRVEMEEDEDEEILSQTVSSP